MAPIRYTRASTDTDLEGILRLQQQNLPTTLPADEIASQGFVTVQHTLDELRKLNDIEKHVIAKAGDEVVAYLLAMTERSQFSIPVLIPMFEMFRDVEFGGRYVSDFHYIVVGQVCVDKGHRGQGILDDCYGFYKDSFRNSYDFAITEIAATNLRSLRAHKRIGFEERYRYKAPDGVEWAIIIWDWNGLGNSTAK